MAAAAYNEASVARGAARDASEKQAELLVELLDAAKEEAASHVGVRSNERAGFVALVDALAKKSLLALAIAQRD